MNITKRHRLILGTIFFALMFIDIGARGYSTLFTLTKTSLRGWSVKKENDKLIVDYVNPRGPALALQTGDGVVALKSELPQVMPILHPPGTYWRVKGGTGYTLTILRKGQMKEIPLQTMSHWRTDKVQDLAYLPNYLVFVVTALIIFLLKTSDKQAFLLALMLGSYVAINNWSITAIPTWIIVIVVIARLVGLWFLPFFLHFFLIFPERSPWLQRFPSLEKFLYLPFILGALPVFGLSRISYIFPNFTNQLFQSWLFKTGIPGMISYFLVLAYWVLGLVSLFVNYRVSSPASRRKLRVVVAGCSAGMINLLLSVVAQMFGLNRAYPQLFGWLNFTLIFTTLLIPISFAYAIIRHKVIPVSLIIRRGVRYVLVSRGSVLLEIIAVFVALTVVLTYIFNYFKPQGVVVGIISAIVGIAAWQISSKLHKKYLAPVIDRKFFRQSYNAQQILADLAQSLRSTTTMPQLLEQVATRIQTALQTENVTVLLRDEATGDFMRGYSCEYNSGDGQILEYQHELRLPHQAGVVGILEKTGQQLEIDLTEKGSFEYLQQDGSDGLSPIEHETLQGLRSSLLLPLSTKDGLIGIISLGPRLGDLPYSREDKHLLMSVAGPATFAIENAKLIERMIEEARRRQELEAENEQRARELEEARQLQLSMLPKQIPQLPHLEIAAYMKPAREVGGDYYDFHLAEDGTLTVVVGDATGHGLRAGTLVTAMKSLFRTYADEHELVYIFNQSSRVLKEMNLRALYMALAMVKVTDHRLDVASAGMPPILIYRAQTKTVEEVLIKAVPLGSVQGYPYRHLGLSTDVGDVVVMMSDGYPERFNQDGEMFDYSRVKESLAETAARSSHEIIDHFVKVAESWAGGRPQDDDMTFVVLKVK